MSKIIGGCGPTAQ
ncbi:hypothetical protein LGN55_28450 [Escherichia coli]|nr:hypothetical protein [Escherichia coli]